LKASRVLILLHFYNKKLKVLLFFYQALKALTVANYTQWKKISQSKDINNQKEKPAFLFILCPFACSA
jgi:hypothetical protein